jgi:hypothetical protein
LYGNGSLVQGADCDAMAANLMGLGFTHEKVVVQAQSSSTHRAAEYIFK